MAERILQVSFPLEITLAMGSGQFTFQVLRFGEEFGFEIAAEIAGNYMHDQLIIDHMSNSYSLSDWIEEDNTGLHLKSDRRPVLFLEIAVFEERLREYLEEIDIYSEVDPTAMVDTGGQFIFYNLRYSGVLHKAIKPTTSSECTSGFPPRNTMLLRLVLRTGYKSLMPKIF